jgi:predicted transcriptional regulator of viral defense system
MDKILEEMKKAGRQAFRTREYAALLGKPDYARIVLHRLNKKGEIFKIKNGHWAFAEAQIEAIACEMSKPSYVSFHSALYLHRLTTQIPLKVQLAVARNAKKYRIKKEAVQEYRIPVLSFNHATIKNEGGIIIATPEQAFADCLLIKRSCPAIILIEAKASIKIDEVKKMLENSKAGTKRLKAILNA